MSDLVRSGNRQRVCKARVVGPAVETSAAIQDEDADTVASLFQSVGALEPPFNPSTLLKYWENSSSLNQNIEAYQVNIDGLGHRLVPRVDFTAAEAVDKVRDGMWIERIRASEARDYDSVMDPVDLLPRDEDVSERIIELKMQARLEKARLESFFEYANPEGSFVKLRTETRHDYEITGNAYWEVLRNRAGEIARFVLVPPMHIRCTPLDQEATTVDERVRVGFSWETVRQHKFFRRYLQRVGSKVVWFKFFGDPRVVSRSTGKIYQDIGEFEREKNPGDQPATELIHFKIHSSGEAYGIPRWIGSLVSVDGSISADQVNAAYFDNKAVPPLAILVSGGRLSDDSVKRLETYVRDHIKGQENFHKILILEAEDAADALSSHEHPKLHFERLVDAQHGDALFQKYDERNIDKVGSSFRMPRLLRGDVRDFNRGTALTSLRFADEQVFEPEREAFDSWINRVILPMLNIVMWTFRSKGPRTRDPEKVAEIILGLTGAGVIVPNEAREMSNDLLGHELDPLEADWARQPIKLTLAGFEPPRDAEDEAEAEAEDGTSGRFTVEEFVSDSKEQLQRMAAESRRQAEFGQRSTKASVLPFRLKD